MEVGSATVRIRPRLADRDVVALAAMEQLFTDVAAAFNRFRETLETSAPLPEGDPDGRAPDPD